MRKLRLPLILSLLVSVPSLNAQQLVQFEEHELTSVLNPWLQTDNAAGLGLSTVRFHGVTELGYNTGNGTLHRAQEGSARNGLNFYSERYDKLAKNWTSWGSFQFIMDREHDRAWSDAMHTYDNNPYLYGSSVPGDYDRQLFDFHVKLSSVSKGPLTYGLGIDYQVGDLSRLRDPRTRVFLADYAALPSVTFRLNGHHVLGLNLRARYQKEKMPNVTTVQDDPNLRYYSFFGMENANAVIGGFAGFQRQFVSALYGGDFQYSFQTSRSQALLSVGAFTQDQQILENIKQTPGSFRSLNYKANLTLASRMDGYLFHLDAKAHAKLGSADEYLQELRSVNNPETGVNSQTWVTLFTYRNQFVSNSYDAELTADLRDLNSTGTDYAWLGGLEAGLYGFRNQYNLPYSSMQVNRAHVGLNGHFRLLNRKEHRLTFKGNVRYELGFDNTLDLRAGVTELPTVGSGTYVQGSYDVATNVLQPDARYYNADMLHLKLESRYSQPLRLKKSNIIGFVRMYVEQTRSVDHGSWTNAGLAFGIIP